MTPRLLALALAFLVSSCAGVPRPVTADERQAWMNCMPIVLRNCNDEAPSCGNMVGLDFEDADDRLAWLGQAGCPYIVAIGRVGAFDTYDRGQAVSVGNTMYQSPSPGYSPSPYAPSIGGPVHVRGYYRRNGTYVAPHTRSRPRR